MLGKRFESCGLLGTGPSLSYFQTFKSLGDKQFTFITTDMTSEGHTSIDVETTLSLLFRTPEENGASSVHEREIENVPTPVSEQIAEDFVRQGREPDASRYQLYRIGEGSEKRLIALDFKEVIGVYSTR